MKINEIKIGDKIYSCTINGEQELEVIYINNTLLVAIEFNEIHKSMYEFELSNYYFTIQEAKENYKNIMVKKYTDYLANLKEDLAILNKKIEVAKDNINFF